MANRDVAPDVKKGSAELLVLALVEDRARHGYEIGKLIEGDRGGVLKFHIASLYPMLYRLERRGVITGRWVEKPGPAAPPVLCITATAGVFSPATAPAGKSSLPRSRASQESAMPDPVDSHSPSFWSAFVRTRVADRMSTRTSATKSRSTRRRLYRAPAYDTAERRRGARCASTAEICRRPGPPAHGTRKRRRQRRTVPAPPDRPSPGVTAWPPAF